MRKNLHDVESNIEKEVKGKLPTIHNRLTNTRPFDLDELETMRQTLESLLSEIKNTSGLDTLATEIKMLKLRVKRHKELLLAEKKGSPRLAPLRAMSYSKL